MGVMCHVCLLDDRGLLLFLTAATAWIDSSTAQTLMSLEGESEHGHLCHLDVSVILPGDEKQTGTNET